MVTLALVLGLNVAPFLLGLVLVRIHDYRAHKLELARQRYHFD
jgi:hypothetical protein